MFGINKLTGLNVNKTPLPPLPLSGAGAPSLLTCSPGFAWLSPVTLINLPRDGGLFVVAVPAGFFPPPVLLLQATQKHT